MRAPSPENVALFKSCVDSGNPRPFLAALDRMSSDPDFAGGARAPLRAFVKAERSRMIKLLTLGLTRGWKTRMAVVELILSRIEPDGPKEGT